MAEQFYVRVEAPAKVADDRFVPSWGEFMQEINDLADRGYRIVATVSRDGSTAAVIMGLGQ